MPLLEWVHQRANTIIKIVLIVLLVTLIGSIILQYRKYGSLGKYVRGSTFLESHQYRNINNRRGPGFDDL